MREGWTNTNVTSLFHYEGIAMAFHMFSPVTPLLAWLPSDLIDAAAGVSSTGTFS